MEKIIGVKEGATREKHCIFDPQGKTFVFCMPGEECAYKYHKEHGGCAYCPIKEGIEDDSKCNQILRELKESNFEQHDNLPVVIFDSSKGLYSANDGQHRICIAYQLGYKIVVEDRDCAGTIYADKDSLWVPFK